MGGTVYVVKLFLAVSGLKFRVEFPISFRQLSPKAPVAAELFPLPSVNSSLFYLVVFCCFGGAVMDEVTLPGFKICEKSRSSLFPGLEQHLCASRQLQPPANLLVCPVFGCDGPCALSATRVDESFARQEDTECVGE